MTSWGESEHTLLNLKTSFCGIIKVSNHLSEIFLIQNSRCEFMCEVSLGIFFLNEIFHCYEYLPERNEKNKIMSF